jgi:hypothetical protein
MDVFGGKTMFRPIFAAIFGMGAILAGCAAAINYSYDPKADFSTIKTYSWTPSSTAIRQNGLIEKNVQYQADQILGKKGFNKASDKPDMVISMNFEYEGGSYQPSYELRMLSLYIHKSENKVLIWQGTASGTINTDAASKDLSVAVNKMLEKFPPKR